MNPECLSLVISSSYTEEGGVNCPELPELPEPVSSFGSASVQSLLNCQSIQIKRDSPTVHVVQLPAMRGTISKRKSWRGFSHAFSHRGVFRHVFCDCVTM